MHRDVIALVEGGYGAQEIMDAFVDAYGERVLMVPTKSGFNRTAWVMPFAALGAGAAFVVMLLRRWRGMQRAQREASTGATIDATAEELARVERDVRSDA
jgi:cytochrome c-type biogenesis protein CcmH/NrfF